MSSGWLDIFPIIGMTIEEFLDDCENANIDPVEALDETIESFEDADSPLTDEEIGALHFQLKCTLEQRS